jgi:DNA-binding transcriptional regulator YiaG
VIRKRTRTSVERDLISGLEGLVSDLKSGEPLDRKYTCRNLVLDLKPRQLEPKEIVKTREILRASQAMFAQFLGVSTKTVCAWESGKAPSDIACRFMEEIQRDPEYWRKRFWGAVKAKAKMPS